MFRNSLVALLVLLCFKLTICYCLVINSIALLLVLLILFIYPFILMYCSPSKTFIVFCYTSQAFCSPFRYYGQAGTNNNNGDLDYKTCVWSVVVVPFNSPRWTVETLFMCMINFYWYKRVFNLLKLYILNDNLLNVFKNTKFLFSITSIEINAFSIF